MLTEVIDNTLVEAGRQLEVTEALAQMLGIDGTAEIEWRFATDAVDEVHAARHRPLECDSRPCAWPRL